MRFVGHSLIATLVLIGTTNHELSAQNVVETLTEHIESGSGGMNVDAAGNIYAADFGYDLSGPKPGTKVFRITPEGEVSVFASGFHGASGNAFDSKGNLFQSNIRAGTVSKITPDGSVSEFTTGLNGPVGISIDPDDNLFVANCRGFVTKTTPDGQTSRFSTSDLYKCPNGITLASDGNLYVANFGNGDVIKIDPEGNASRFATIRGNNNGHILFANGVLYVVARSAHQIYELSLDGDLTLLAGSGKRGLTDGPALEAELSLTNDIAVSTDGRTLYFNDVVHQEGDQILSPIVIRKLILAD
ncbi:MAG: hypothetical protein ABFS14_02335 [Gemmatimonadota bacterium]